MTAPSYTKPKGQIPDYESPVVIPRCEARSVGGGGAVEVAAAAAAAAAKNTVDEFCLRIHKALREQFK